MCVSEKAFFEDPSWLAEGFELLKQWAGYKRDYLLPRIKGDGTLERRDGGFGPPPGDGWATDCGPDLLVGTARVLPTGLSLNPIPPADRDMLGRWKPEGSDIYMRAYGGRVARLQAIYADAGRRTARKSWTRRRSRRGLATG